MIKQIIAIVTISLIGAQPSFAVLSSSNLTYLGAFRVPTYDDGAHKWEYGGYGLVYIPDGDSGNGSLMSAGRDYDDAGVQVSVGEISIPTPVIDSTISNLNRASHLGSFADITEGDIAASGNNSSCSSAVANTVRGLAYLNSTDDKIYISFWDYYNTEQCDLYSTGYATYSTWQSDPDYQGSWWLDDSDLTEHSKDYAGYLFNVPSGWATTYLSGKQIATGQSREGGAYGRGPGLWVTDIGSYSDSSPPTDDKLPAKSLIFYATTEGDNFPDYSVADQWYGAAWVEQGEDSAVIYAGAQCFGDTDYHLAYYCGADYANPVAMTHTLTFYDPDDLVAVAQGTADPWSVQPTEVVDLSTLIDYHLPDDWDRGGRVRGGVTYDSANNIIYIMMIETDSKYPVVHAFEVNAILNNGSCS